MSLICIGCAKTFQTQRSLSAHEAQCDLNKALTANIHSGHHHRRANRRKKVRERKQRSPSPKESLPQHEALRLSPRPSFPTDVDDFPAEVGHFIYRSESAEPLDLRRLNLKQLPVLHLSLLLPWSRSALDVLSACRRAILTSYQETPY